MIDTVFKKSLEQILAERKIYRESDIEIIVRYFTENECYEEAVDLIVGLLKQRIRHQDGILAMSRSWIPSLFQEKRSNSTTVRSKVIGVIPRTTNEEQALIDRLTAYYLLDMKIPEEDLEKARELIPRRTRPLVVYNPMLEWLKDNYGITFKEETNEER